MRDFKNINVSIKNLNIHYSVRGQGDKLLIIEGLGTTTKSYDKLISLLSKNNRVYILDLPGFGISDEPNKVWNIDDYIDCILEFISKNDIKKCSIMSNSIGCSIIIKMISDSELKFKINKLILMSSNGINPLDNLNAYHNKKTKRFFLRILFNKLSFKLFLKLEKKVLSIYGEKIKISNRMKKTIDNLIKVDINKYLPNIYYDVLLLWGKKDTETPIKDANKMRMLLPNCYFKKLEKGNHYLFIQDPSWVKQNIEIFLKK